MGAQAATELTLIRHAPALTEGRLCGRTDVGADLGDAARIAAVRAALAPPARLIASPAQRCVQTCTALWGAPQATDADLWEQDFGAWDGAPLTLLPDLGPLPPEVLAQHRPPGGESFADLCARIGPALNRIAGQGSATIVAHAGTVRAGLALALGAVPQALAFQVAPLSVTRLTRHAGGWSVAFVNWQPAP